MSDLGERLQRLPAPQLPNPEIDEYESLLGRKYNKAYKAFYRDKNRTKCGCKLLEITTAVMKEARTDSVWQSYILCKAFFLGALFEARPKALDNVDQIRRNLAIFSPYGETSGSSNFQKDYAEMKDLRIQLEERLHREKHPQFIKETWLFHSTTSWPVRLTDAWLEQTGAKSQ
ncbi:MAG: hypothetical protein Q9176_007181 [Flavoplaca citrina]